GTSAEAAWSGGRLRGRRVSPSLGRPSELAPEETTHTGSPPRTIAPISRPRARSSWLRTPPPSPATRLDPNLTRTVNGAVSRPRRPGTGAARGRDRSRGRADLGRGRR